MSRLGEFLDQGQPWIRAKLRGRPRGIRIGALVVEERPGLVRSDPDAGRAIAGARGNQGFAVQACELNQGFAGQRYRDIGGISGRGRQQKAQRQRADNG